MIGMIKPTIKTLTDGSNLNARSLKFNDVLIIINIKLNKQLFIKQLINAVQNNIKTITFP